MIVHRGARWTAITGVLLGTAILCLGVQVVTGQTTAGTTVTAAIVALAGMLTAQSFTPSRVAALRLVLGIGGLLTLGLLAGVPMPPQTTEAQIAFALLVSSSAMAAVASVVAERHRLLSRVLVAILSLYGVVILVTEVRITAAGPGQEGPGVTISRSFVILLAASWMVASWTMRPRHGSAPAGAAAAAT